MRKMESELNRAAECLGEFVGTSAANLVFVDNATTGMNVVAASIDLQPGDEVLATNHTYGAVLRIWRKKCQVTAAKLVVQKLPEQFESADQVVDCLFEKATAATKLIVCDHVTSPTAVILPVEDICRRARNENILTCIDGPHALAMLPLDLDKLDCDFYTASCHKWLSAPFGSGFLYVHPDRQQAVQPVVVSWGGSISAATPRWQDEFTWIGTRDPAPFLAVPAAIEFLHSAGVGNFRRRSHRLAHYAWHRLATIAEGAPMVPDSRQWYGSMIAIPLPPGREPPPRPPQQDPLQDALWERFRIEVPIMHWEGRRFVRVSCHLYTLAEEIDRLAEALEELLA